MKPSSWNGVFGRFLEINGKLKANNFEFNLDPKN